MRKVYGKHVIGNLYGIAHRSKDEIMEAVKKAAEIANSTLLAIRGYEVGGEMGGVSVIAVVLESHIAVHTWEKQRYATIDVYTCGEHTKPEDAFEYLAKFFKPEKVETYIIIDRSQR